MCGITGILQYAKTTQAVDEALVVKMRDTMMHRGPDDAGVFVSPQRNIGLGFRRLAIVDLSPAANQPMFSSDKTLVIVFNGEIYNHLVLRKELEAKGYRYRTRSDTETILNAYQEYGLDFVHKLLGMFALAIWDERKQRLVLARDRIGIKPLYYTFAEGNFLFGSEIKAILQHPSVRREMNEEAFDHYLTFLVPPAPMTMFKDIYKLEPGHRMVIGADGDIHKEQYWDPVPSGEQPSIDVDGSPVARSPFVGNNVQMTEASCIATLRTLLKQSIKDRMMSDVPFGVFLSGGIDSSTNVALMAELMDRPVDTFSVGFRDLEKYNELQFARQIAQEFRTNHHEIIIDHRDAFDLLPKLIYHHDEPLADPVSIPLYFVSKLARDNGTIVVQVGEGSDEQFVGYEWMLRELRFHDTAWKLYRSLPRVARAAIFRAAGAVLEKRHSYLALDYVRKGYEGEELFWGGAINFTETHKRHLLNGWRRRTWQTPHEFAQRWHQSLLEKSPNADYLQRMVYLEFKHRLPELLLMRVDKMSMATSVEARVPFLDHRLVEYSMQIPRELKLKNGVPKYLLKKAVEGIIPHKIIYRKKQGFAAPVNEWLRGEWFGFLENTLVNSLLVREGILHKDFIITLIRQHRDRRRDEGQNLWNLLNLALWHKYWMEGKSIA
ncbi:MAG TPA: asparagine synthase (glutamine-hydrolyzing) [Bacteroidota bacterium]|nr:asparagine synthase (glutamine-hydrolyzing) [Bacteroidota bacterium]